MICIVIKGPTVEEAYQQISKALRYADLVELRLDYFTLLDLAALKILRSYFSIPMIFALRSQRQGGSYRQSEEYRLADIRRLVALKPEYLDLETHVSPRFIQDISSQFPEIKLILSYHHFAETPLDLEGIYQEMQKIPAFFYKIAVMAKKSLDALRLVCWAKKSHGPIIAISMGPHGEVSRILGPVMGCPITYAALEEDEESACGQLSAEILIERYHHHLLNPRTAIYGLIGDPVCQSISDETHNALIAAYGLNAVYVKMQVNPTQLSAFLPFAKQLPFHGLSVTMPLKEHVLPFLDDIDPEALHIGAVNTLLFDKGHIFGFNTDGMGALNAIERENEVKGKRIVIIGAGGASRAIAYEAQRRGGLITILNRDVKKALRIAQRLHCLGQGLDEMLTCSQAGYDILINCTSVPLPIAVDHILPKAIVMDLVTKPKETAFLKQAMDKGCQVIYGEQMFIEQALGQFDLWFKKGFDMQESRRILEKKLIFLKQKK